VIEVRTLNSRAGSAPLSPELMSALPMADGLFLGLHAKRLKVSE
jgi:hypothetical protein